MSMKGAMALMTLSGMFSLSKVNRELMNTCVVVCVGEGGRDRVYVWRGCGRGGVEKGR
jgi:hypothetical protein